MFLSNYEEKKGIVEELNSQRNKLLKEGSTLSSDLKKEKAELKALQQKLTEDKRKWKEDFSRATDSNDQHKL